MKLLTLTVAALITVGCRGTNQSQGGSVSPTAKETTTAVSMADQSKTDSAVERVPTNFTNVDFKNFSYPVRFKNQTIRLKDGHVEFLQDKVFYNAWFDLKAVDYADVNDDGKKEAIVQLVWVSCGASCDGGSWLFFIYESAGNRAKLLSKIETGSLAYQECGLKSFVLEGRSLSLETFQPCAFDGVSIRSTQKRGAKDPIGKFGAEEFTRFRLVFAGNRFKLQKREIFPFPQGEVLNYQSTVEISDE